MKIICLADDNVITGSCEDSPSWYILPDSAILKSGKPFFLPEFAPRFVFYPALVVRIERLGKSISRKFANRYYSSVAPGAMIRVPEIIGDRCRRMLPPGIGICFDNACWLGEFIPVDDMSGMAFRCDDSDEDIIAEWKVDNLRACIDSFIADVSSHNTLKIGDLIYLPLPSNGMDIRMGMSFEAIVNSKPLLNINVK